MLSQIKENAYLMIYFTVLSGVLGACMGSFLHCMAWRIVHGESSLMGRSHCDKCGHTLNFWDLVPILSYLFSGGKCRYCKEKITVKHLAYELISAACFVFVFIRFNISLQVIEFLIFTGILLVCSFADLEGYIIPDRFIVTGILVRLIFIILTENTKSVWLDSVLGGIVTAGVLLIVVLVFEKILKKEAMGGGDIKLIAMCGLYLGFYRNFLMLFIACIIGIVFGVVANAKNKASEESVLFPWGPSIAIAAFISLMVGNQIISAYMGLFNI